LGVQQNAAMYSNAHAWMQTFDCCCKMQDHAESLGCHGLEWQCTVPSPAMQMS